MRKLRLGLGDECVRRAESPKSHGQQEANLALLELLLTEPFILTDKDREEMHEELWMQPPPL